MNEEVKQIMLDKLKEMAEIKPSNCINYGEYIAVCDEMNEIAQNLLRMSVADELTEKLEAML